MKKKWLSMFIAMAILATVFAGCGSGAAETSSSAASPAQSSDTPEQSTADTTESSNKDSVVIAIQQEGEPAAGFDPITGWGTWQNDPLIQSVLVNVQDDVSVAPDLATEYSISDDGLVWTFKIRSDVKFTDGTALTAKDVAFTFNTAKSTVSSRDLSMFEKAEAIDDTTVEMTLNKPYSLFVYIVACTGIVPEHAYDAATYGTNPIGSGPFILKQWDKGEQVIFEANPDYYGEVSKIKQLTVVFMTEEASYAAAQSGQVDVAYSSAAFTINPIEGYEIVPFPTTDHRELNLPVIPAGTMVTTINGDKEVEGGNDVTSNLAVRQAISYAIDRQKIADVVFFGYAAPAFSASPGMPWENEAVRVEYDLEKAKSIMEADGWALNADGIYEKDGLVAEIEVTVMAEATRQSILMAVKEMLDEFGIRIIIKGGMSWEEIDPTTYSMPNLIGGGAYSPISDIGRYYTGKNRAVYSNETVDKHIDNGLAAKTLEETYEHFKLAAWDGATGHATIGDCPFVFIVTVDAIYFTREGLNVTDQQIIPHDTGWFICDNVNKWSWD